MGAGGLTACLGSLMRSPKADEVVRRIARARIGVAPARKRRTLTGSIGLVSPSVPGHTLGGAWTNDIRGTIGWTVGERRLLRLAWRYGNEASPAQVRIRK